MSTPQEDRLGWTIQDAEDLILSLKGVSSARLVTRPGGEVTEIHVVTTEEVTAKQTVRNVESALLAHFGLEVDHRKISVAQTKERPKPFLPPDPLPVMLVPEPPRSEKRILFIGHQVETERAHRVRHKVEVEWRDERYTGVASAPDLSRSRLEAAAQATVAAVEASLAATLAEDDTRSGIALEVDGVKLVDAFDRQFVLVAVHALGGRDVVSLAGATVVEESPDRAAILATLQATDRWVRGRV